MRAGLDQTPEVPLNDYLLLLRDARDVLLPAEIRPEPLCVPEVGLESGGFVGFEQALATHRNLHLLSLSITSGAPMSPAWIM